MTAKQGSERVDQTTIVVLNIRNFSTALLLPDYGEDVVAEWYDLNIDGLSPGERLFLDLESQLHNL